MQAALTDQAPFKAAMRTQWDAAAPGWNAHAAVIREWLSLPTEAMCRMAGVTTGARVLDVAAGAGEQTLILAELVGSRGHVLATDLSPAILALARQKLDAAGFTQVETRVADGEDLGLAEASFDAAVCRLGLMFFPDPLLGLRQMHRALRPGGGACTMVFSRPERNPCLTILLSTALRHAGLPAGDPALPGGLLSLGQPGQIDRLFIAAGFHNVATTALDVVFRLPSVDDYLHFIRSSASPVMGILARLAPAAAEAAWAEMRERLDVYTCPDGWAGPNELLLTAGRRPLETA